MLKEFEEVQDQLTRIRPTLPPKLQITAAYLLENPEEIAMHSMSKIASDCGVAIPNLSRLAKIIGFEKYNELRDVYRKQIQAKASKGYYPERADILQSLGKMSGDGAIWSAFRASALRNIENAYKQIDAKLVGKIVEKLLTRDQIHIVGLQASYPITQYFKYIGSMVTPKFKMLCQQNGVIADDFVDIGDNDALLCLTLQPCARGTITVAKRAYENGLYVVGITESRVSPLASYSTDLLITSCDSPLFFESYVGSTAIMELLIGFLTLRADHEVVERIKQIESDRKVMGEYFTTDKE